MVVFWILTGLATALAALLVLTGARRGADAAVDLEPDLAALELAELDRMRTRGLLAEEAWAAARAEAGRRLLARTTPSPVLAAGRKDRQWVLLGLGLTAAAALGVYVLIGAPGLGDQPYERRVDDWASSTETLEPVQIAAVLSREAALRTGDPQILSMLGAARFQAGDSIGAASAFRRALALAPDDARSWARLGESLVRSQDGVVGADAEAAFLEAVRRDPGQLGALYFLGEAALARGDLVQATAMWTPLIGALQPADPRRADLETRLAAAAAR